MMSQSAQSLQDVEDGEPAAQLCCTACGHTVEVRADLLGSKIDCPQCGAMIAAPAIPIAECDDARQFVETDPPTILQTFVAYARRMVPIVACTVVVLAVIGCSVYANLSFLITDRANFKYFPPFAANYTNNNKHFGAEYLSIARSLVAEEGFRVLSRKGAGRQRAVPVENTTA